MAPVGLCPHLFSDRFPLAHHRRARLAVGVCHLPSRCADYSGRDGRRNGGAAADPAAALTPERAMSKIISISDVPNLTTEQMVEVDRTLIEEGGPPPSRRRSWRSTCPPASMPRLGWPSIRRCVRPRR